MNDSSLGKWTGPPSKYFFVPGRDAGLEYVNKPDWFLQRVPGAHVRQYGCSDYPNVQEVIERNIEPRWKVVTPAIFEFNTVPMVARDVVFRGGTAEIGGKCLSNGASGDRSYSRYLKNNPGSEAFERANRFFKIARSQTKLDLPISLERPRSLPVGIECRNRSNFYHFMTEALPQLVHYADTKAEQIVFHCRSDNGSAFADGFIELLFPELKGRVHFSDRAAGYELVSLPLNFRHMVYSNGDPGIVDPLRDTGDDKRWQLIDARIRQRKFVFKNSYDVSMRLLRERALSIIDPKLIASMPKKIWVSRDNRNQNVNQRVMGGEDRLVAELKNQGFEQVFFEHLSPMEQIAAVHGAEVIGAAHGAFFGHMMFAQEKAHVIEVGSVQTLMHRWGDFLGNAHASGCHYSKVMADTAQNDPSDIRPITEGLVGVQVGQRAIDLIAMLAENGQMD